MDYELISEEEYEGLPAEDDKCFVAFETICRRNMTRMIDQNTSGEFDSAVREQYMYAVSKVAEACQIPNVRFDPTEGGNFQQVFAQFCLAVQGEVTRIRILSRGERHPYSVLLTGSTRTKIEHYIGRLRDFVGKSDLDEGTKRRLNDKLDQLTAELSGHRISFAKTMALLAAVMATLGSTVTIAADGPNAVANIMRLIGEDKASEDAASQRLTPPPKALPSPAIKTQPHKEKLVHRAAAAELDDDIPF